jgi:hypothetical protein
MKLRSTILIAVSLFAVTSTYSQTSDAEADAIINLLGVKKKEAVSKMVLVQGKDSAAFWKIYDEYQQSNRATAKARMALYERTAQAYGRMDPAVADSLATAYFTNRAEQEKSLETYYKKIKTATNGLIAFEFYQAEVYLLTSIRTSIMQQIPTYGQLMNSGNK